MEAPTVRYLKKQGDEQPVMRTETVPDASAVSSGRWIADVVMVFVATIWGLNNVVVKASLDGWVSPLAFNAVRFCVGSVAIALLAWRMEPNMGLPRGLWWKVALLGLLGNGLNQYLFINGIALTAASNAGMILALIPIQVAIIGAVTGLDRMTLRLLLGAVISFGGIVIVVTQGAKGFTGFLSGDLMLLAAGTAWAGYTVVAGPLARRASPIKVTTYGMACASIALLGFALPDLARQDWSAISIGSWGGILYAGLLSNALGYGLYVWSVHRNGSSRAAMWSNLSPLVTAFAAWALLGERWLGPQWLGAAFVLIGVLTARWEALSAALRRPVRQS